MSTVKFRAFGPDGNWYYGGPLTETLSDFFAGFCINSPDEILRYETLGQFTGLTDKNGQEIYEGDVVIDRNKKDKAWIIEYRTDTEYVGFIPKEIGTNDISLFISWTNMEIVGDMYADPELLK